MRVKDLGRRRKILDLLNDKSHLSVQQLAELASVSLPTIRRDLRELEEQGLVIRENGIVLLQGISAETKHYQRENHNLDLKKRIAKHVAANVSDGEVIALDIGTTCVEIAKELCSRSNLTVFTSSVQAATILSRTNLSVYLVGGFLRNAQMASVGSIAIDTILKFKYDRFYMNLAGINNADGPTDYNLEETEVKRAFISRSREVTAVLDRTKIGKSALVKVCELEQINEIVTNRYEHPAEPLNFDGKLTLIE
ncbi:DeoR/GlpR family DNA-binding transcription regulator [Paenibacillaceae bacterium WGS1546]|uniref:DeoR/GlpR family DNA-binding transcription regulator n=1 Tax=Cohnella sp. WGS1546 TaxID=3366810 RepID=UPI00372D4910